MKNIFRVLLCIGLLTIAKYAVGLNVVGTDNPTILRDTILGTGITPVGTPTYLGSGAIPFGFSSGTFTDGIAAGIGFESGIILTSGQATGAIGPNGNGGDPETLSGQENSVNHESTNLVLPGDVDLTALAGEGTFDASVLEFDFQTAGGDLFFNFVFGSEEYIDFVDTQFNDVFGFFVDGMNIALVPGTSTPVTINTINPISNSGLYRNNVDDGNTTIPNLGLNNEYDGLTTVLVAQALSLGAGMHHIKIAVADAGDEILDAGVFIEGGTFSDTPPPTAVIPEPGTFILFGIGTLVMLGLGWKRRKKSA